MQRKPPCYGHLAEVSFQDCCCNFSNKLFSICILKALRAEVEGREKMDKCIQDSSLNYLSGMWED